MKQLSLAVLLAVGALSVGQTHAQSVYEPYAFTTLAGLALSPGSTDNTGSAARFDIPWGLAVDAANNVYVADTLNHTIRKITAGGVVTTLAGVAGTAGFNDGAASTALFSRPTGVAVNGAGTVVYVADYNNQIIRQISGGIVTTLAGSAGISGTADGTATAARFRNPFGVAVNSAGTVAYVTDQNNQTIRRITVPGGIVTTLAGAAGVGGSTDDPANNLNARFNTPKGIAVDSGGNLYVADAGNFTVRKILSTGGVSTLAGSVFASGFNDGLGNAARFSLLTPMSPYGGPCGVAVDSGGTIYVTDQGNHTIRKITPTGSVTTLAGLATVSGSSDGVGSGARFNFPAGVAVDSTGTLYVADTVNHTIRVGIKRHSPLVTCAPDKTVECGTAWQFDTPTAGPDLTISVLNTVTNSDSCTTVITRTWQVTDGCVPGTKSWSPLGAGMNGEVWALAEMGGDLYAGGLFTTAGGASANYIAKWDGTNWTPLGSGINNGMNGGVFALAALGGKLYAAGFFTTAGGLPAANIAQWDGANWSPLGTGLVASGAVESLTVIGTDLYAGGFFTTAGGVPANLIAKWDTLTSVWSPLGSGINDRVNSLTAIGTDLYAGGQLTIAGGVSANYMAKWDSLTSAWSALGTGMDLRVGGGLGVLGGNLYAGGVFTTAGGNSANRVAKWDVANSIWSPLGTGMNGEVEGFAVIGTDLFACGGFTNAGGVAANRVAQWDGTTWSPLGAGMNNGVWRLAVIGPDLYAGGIFTMADGASANYVAKWSGNCDILTTCSQTVTVVDTTPPTITCPPKDIVVPLGANCELKIPTIQPPTSDNCTPRSQLVFTQDPPAGTVVSGPCEFVTVTVRDACENTSQCRVRVCGQDKTPPTLACPKSVSLIDCFVPDVLALVSASDNCTVSNRLVFTQSPPPGTAIAAGGNMVTVTVTDEAGNTSTCFIPLTNSGPQSFLNVMFNTGVNSNKVVLPFSSVDPHYTISSVPVGTPTGTGFYNAPNALVGPHWMPLWSASSEWISLYGNNSNHQYPSGFYTYTNQFVLPSGMDPSTASLSGRWSAGVGGKMYVNGSLIPASTITAPPIGSYFGSWQSFTINSGFLGFPAINTMTFVMEAQGTPLGWGGALRVEYTDALINCNTCTPPVILHKTPNQSQRLNSTAVLSVSVWGTPPLTIQWYHNNLPISDGGHYSGVNTPNLTVTPLSYADAGNYYAVVSNACGETRSNPARLTVSKGWPSWWGWWNFSRPGKPLSAVFGPDLIVDASDDVGVPSVSFGTTMDFDLPNIGGKMANVLSVPSEMPAGRINQLPLAELVGDMTVSNFTLIQDFFVPSNSTDSTKLFNIFDRWGILTLSTMPGAAGIGLNVSGMIDGMTVNLNSTISLQEGDWNRACLVIVNSDSSESNGKAGCLTLYLNGEPCGTLDWDGINSSPELTSESTVTVMSSPDSPTTTESYVSSIAFFAEALTPETFASFGSPNNGAINETSVAEDVPEIAIEQPEGMGITNGGTKDFGSATVGSPTSLIFTVRNTGTADLAGLAVSISGSNASDFVLSELGATTLTPGATTTFTVTFTSAAAGSRSAALQIASNDENANPFDIPLVGTGIEVDPYNIAFVGTLYDLRVGNHVAFDLNRLLTAGETVKVGGKPPSGIKFSPTTGLLSGIIAGKPGIYLASIQVLLGKTLVRTIPLSITVREFPPTLIGSFHFLMEDALSVPIGVCKITITKANGWSATLESAGASKKRSAKGPFILAEGSPVAPITVVFPAIAATSSVPGVPAVTVSISIDGSTPTITGTYDSGILRGFRLAKTGEMPAATVPYSLVFDAGEQDGFNVPAGFGWMKGKVSTKGIGTFHGPFGDGTAASLTLGVSAFGQAILWSQPYKNKSSYMAGIVTLENLGQTTPGAAPFTDEVWWTKTKDLKTFSYSEGFPGMPVTVRTSRWTAPASATALGSTLGWRDNRKAEVVIMGAGLSNQEPQTTLVPLPTEFTLDDKFALITSQPVSPMPVAWKGKVSKTDGAISGKLILPAGFSNDFPSGSAAVSGVIIQDEQWGNTTGCGQIKVHTTESKGSFRTAAIILGQ